MKYDLTDCTFIIPLCIETDDRLRNVILSTSYLLHHFNTNIIIKEVDQESNYTTYVKPVLDRISPEQTGLTYVFEKSDEDIFHRTKVLNDMILMSKTKCIVNYDTDIILPIQSYIDAYSSIVNSDYDIVYPYRFGSQGERKVVFKTDFTTFENLNSFENNPELISFLRNYDYRKLDDSFFYAQHGLGEGWAEYGMVQFFNRQVYIDGYLENEGFIAYAPEDVERFHRFTKLGYRIGRIDNHAYHIEHKRTENSWYTNPHMQHNFSMWEQLKNLTKEELIEYYKNQQYIKERGL